MHASFCRCISRRTEHITMGTVVDDIFVSNIYTKPWTRNVTYFMGMTLAYVIYKTDGEIKLSKV